MESPQLGIRNLGIKLKLQKIPNHVYENLECPADLSGVITPARVNFWRLVWWLVLF